MWQICKTNEYMNSTCEKPTAAYLSGHDSGRKGPSALEIATFAVVQLENSPLFNSGHGAVFTRDGTNELEASVMVSRGFKKRGVGVMGLKHVRNPILLARKMLEHGEEDLASKGQASSVPGTDGCGNHDGDLDVPSAQGHTQLHGRTAEQLARKYGLEMVDPSYFFTQQRWNEHIRALEKERQGRGLGTWDAAEYLPQGTCGAVALDEHGVICAATSTGGMTNKLSGRIGDTPVVGAGFFCEEWEEQPSTKSAWDTFSDVVANARPGLSITGPLKGFLADCFPSPFTYAPANPTLLGSGNITVSRSMGASGTGNGDSFLRINAVRTVAAMARYKPTSTSRALTHVVGPNGELQRSAGERWGKTGEGEGGMIGIECIVERDGNGRIVKVTSEVAMDYNSGGMYRAWIDDNGKPIMSIWSNDSEDDDFQ